MAPAFIKLLLYTSCLILSTAAQPMQTFAALEPKTEEAIRFLSDEIRLGRLHKVLPARYADVQTSWYDFLEFKGLDTILRYFGKRNRTNPDPVLSGRDEFLRLAQPGDQLPARFSNAYDVPKNIAKRLVRDFAEQQAVIRSWAVADERLRELGKDLKLGGTKRRRRQRVQID